MMTEVKAGTQVQVLLTPSRSGQLSLGVGAWAWGLVWRRVRVPVRGVVGDRMATQVAETLAERDVPWPDAGRQARDLDKVLSDDADLRTSPYVAAEPWNLVRNSLADDVAGTLSPLYLGLHARVWQDAGGGVR